MYLPTGDLFQSPCFGHSILIELPSTAQPLQITQKQQTTTIFRKTRHIPNCSHSALPCYAGKECHAEMTVTTTQDSDTICARTGYEMLQKSVETQWRTETPLRVITTLNASQHTEVARSKALYLNVLGI